MKVDKLISVVIPVYNTNTSFLSKCLASISNQSYENIEVLIIDSSTNSDTEKVISDFKRIDNRFIVLRSEKGVSKQRNLGIESASGKYIAFVDSDDYIHKDYFSNMLRCLIRYNADLVFPQLIKETYANDVLLNTYILPTEPIVDRITENNFFVNTEKNRLVNPIKMYKRELIGLTRFREDLTHGEDMIFNFELSKKTFVSHFSPESIYVFTGTVKDSAAKKRFNKNGIKIIDVMYKLYKKGRKKYPKDNAEGIYYQFSYLFTIYYYEAVRQNKIIYLLRFSKYRFLYLRSCKSWKDYFYILFPLIRKLAKKIMRRH